MIIGLCGSLFSGKEKVAAYLIFELGFIGVSDISKLYPSSNSQQTNHSSQHIIENGSPSQLLISQTWKRSVNIVIQNCQHDSQLLQPLLKRPYFVLVYVDSPLLNRYQNALSIWPQSCHIQTFIKIDDAMRFAIPLKHEITQNVQSNKSENGIDDIQKFKQQYASKYHGAIIPICDDNSNQNSIVSLSKLQSWASLTIENIYKDTHSFWQHLRTINFFSTEFVRPKWDSYFMSLASLASKRANCMKRRVGCVIVCENNRVIATGYNGTASNTRNCNDGGCPRCNQGIFTAGTGLDQCLCLHAEENAIIESGRERCMKSTLYTTLFPCVLCARKIVQAGIKRIVYDDPYFKDDPATKLLEEGGVIVSKLASSSQSTS